MKLGALQGVEFIPPVSHSPYLFTGCLRKGVRAASGRMHTTAKHNFLLEAQPPMIVSTEERRILASKLQQRDQQHQASGGR